MTEISVSSHREINITETSDGLIRISIGQTAYLLTPYEAGTHGMALIQIATKVTLNRPNEVSL